jgi:hypothetical protein
VLQRLTIIIRLQREAGDREWHGQVETIHPRQVAAFRQRSELWALLERWLGQPAHTTSIRESEFSQTKQERR